MRFSTRNLFGSQSRNRNNRRRNWAVVPNIDDACLEARRLLTGVSNTNIYVYPTDSVATIEADIQEANSGTGNTMQWEPGTFNLAAVGPIVYTENVNNTGGLTSSGAEATTLNWANASGTPTPGGFVYDYDGNGANDGGTDGISFISRPAFVNLLVMLGSSTSMITTEGAPALPTDPNPESFSFASEGPDISMLEDSIQNTVDPINLGARTFFSANGVTIGNCTGQYLVQALQADSFGWTADAAGTTGYANDFSSVFFNDAATGFDLVDVDVVDVSNVLAFENTFYAGAMFETTSFVTPGENNLNLYGVVGQSGAINISNVYCWGAKTEYGFLYSTTESDLPFFSAPAQVNLTNVDADWTQTSSGSLANPVGAVNLIGVIGTVTNSAITNSLSQYGAGINAIPSSPLDSTTINGVNEQCNENLNGSGGGIGIELAVPAPVTINDCNILGGYASQGAGVYIASTSSTAPIVAITNDAIFSNENATASAAGAGVYLAGKMAATMGNNAMMYNDAIFTDYGTLTVADAATAQFFATGGATVSITGGEYSVLSPGSYTGANVTISSSTRYGSASNPFTVVFTTVIDWNYAAGVSDLSFGASITGDSTIA